MEIVACVGSPRIWDCAAAQPDTSQLSQGMEVSRKGGKGGEAGGACVEVTDRWVAGRGCADNCALLQCGTCCYRRKDSRHAATASARSATGPDSIAALAALQTEFVRRKTPTYAM